MQCSLLTQQSHELIIIIIIFGKTHELTQYTYYIHIIYGRGILYSGRLGIQSIDPKSDPTGIRVHSVESKWPKPKLEVAPYVGPIYTLSGIPLHILLLGYPFSSLVILKILANLLFLCIKCSGPVASRPTCFSFFF